MTIVSITLAVTGLLLLALAQHAFVTYPLSLLWLVRSRRGDQAGTARADGEISFAILMCAYNEQDVIERKVLNLLALREREPGLEILVYVDGSSDRTVDILRPYKDRLTLLGSRERRGKTHGMNLMASRANASVLVFTDANVMIDDSALINLRRHFADPSIGCVCGTFDVTNPDASATANTGSLYLRFDHWVRAAESRLGSVMGAHGGLFAIRRSLHRPPPRDIIDDMFVSLSILCDGYRVVQADDVVGYEAAATTLQDEFRRKVRIACQAWNVHRLLWPRLRRMSALNLYQYLSHKPMRWLSGVFLAAGVCCVFAAAVLAGHGLWATLVLAAIAAALLAGKRFTLWPLSQIAVFIVALAANAFGGWRSLRGERYQTWNPATSIRKHRTGA